MMNFQNQDSGGTSHAVLSQENYQISNVVETKMLYLSTKSSQCTPLNGDMKSHVSFDLKNYLDYQGDETIQSITLSMPYAIICNSNYQINDYNNKLDYIVNGVSYSFRFTNGNYSSDYFMQQFLLKTLATSGAGFNITLDNISVKFTITNSLYTFTILSSSTCGYIMGINTNLVSSTGSAPFTATAIRVVNFLPNPLFRITIENNSIYNGQVLGSAGNAQYSNVLASIPNVTKANTQIVYQNFSDEFSISPSGQTTLILGILDDNGNYVDFNGISSYFQLRVRIYRRVKRSLNTFNEILGGATNLRNLIEDQSETIQKPVSSFL